MRDYYTPAELSELWGLSRQTLATWRANGIGPAFEKLGPGPKARVRYPKKAVKAYKLARSPGEWDQYRRQQRRTTR